MRYVRLTVDIGLPDKHFLWGRRSLRWWLWPQVREALWAYLIGSKYRFVSAKEISEKEFQTRGKRHE